MKNVHLVTGGNGFLGHLIARRLLEAGERVRVLDVWDFPARSPHIEFINADILDRDAVARAMKDVSVVHHNAALVPLTKSGARYAAVNTEGSRIAAQEAAAAGAEAFIYMSSSSVFGTAPSPVTNQSPLQPFESYGRSKLIGEQLARDICRGNKMVFIAVRPRTILGEGRLGIFQILFRWIRENRRIYTLGGGGNFYQFIHALDLIDFYMLALAREKPGSYNVGAEHYRTLRDDLEGLIQDVGSASTLAGIPVAPAVAALKFLDFLKLSPLGPYHYTMYHRSFYFDVAPLKAMGWQPKYSNRAMFLESYRWFEQNEHKLQAAQNASAHRKPVQEGVLNLLRRLS